MAYALFTAHIPVSELSNTTYTKRELFALDDLNALNVLSLTQT